MLTEMSVTVGGLDFENTLLDFQNRNIEGTTTQVENSDNTVVLLLQTVGESSSSRLVDNTEDVKTSDLASILGCLTLGVVEVCRNSNNGILDGLAEIVLGSLLHLSENKTADLRRRILVATSFNPGITIGVLDDLVGNLLEVALNLVVGELASDQTLGSEQSVLRVDNSLALGCDTNQSLTILGKSDNRGSCPGTYSSEVSQISHHVFTECISHYIGAPVASIILEGSQRKIFTYLQRSQ